MPPKSKAQAHYMRARCGEGKQWACEYVKGHSTKNLPARVGKKKGRRRKRRK